MGNIKARETSRKNVAAAMISEETVRAEQGIVVEPAKEIKKRYNLTLLPSVYEKIQQIAFVERKSASEIAGELFEAYIKEHESKLEEYENLKK